MSVFLVLFILSISNTADMRVNFAEPDVEEYLSILIDPSLVKVRGGSLSDIKVFKSPHYYQRGSGLFSILSGIARKALPFLFKHVAPSAVQMASNVISDVGQGAKLKSSLKRRGVSALKQVGKSVLSGGGKKRRKVKRTTRKASSRKTKKKKRARNYKRDIFDEMVLV